MTGTASRNEKRAAASRVSPRNKPAVIVTPELFNKTREDFLAEIAAEPIANRAWRLRRLTELFEQATDKGDREEARKALEQAAKEVGNVFTNLAKVQGIALPGQVDPGKTSIDELRNMLADRIGPGLAQLAAQQQPTKH
jgi:hypothetical protein